MLLFYHIMYLYNREVLWWRCLGYCICIDICVSTQMIRHCGRDVTTNDIVHGRDVRICVTTYYYK